MPIGRKAGRSYSVFAIARKGESVFPEFRVILFLNWRGEPALKRSQRDAPASGETGSALGARQFETLPVGLPVANQQTVNAPDTLVAFSNENAA